MALIALLTAIEWATPVGRFSLRSRVPGFLFWFAALTLARPTLVALQWLWGLAGISPLLTIPLGRLGTIAAVIAGIVFADFLAYWNHRFQHRFLWPVHAVHHSVTELNAANGYNHFTEKGFRFLLFGVPLSLIQFDAPATPVAVLLSRELLERYIHSPTTLHMGPLRWIFVDNRYHRIHHSLEPKHFDKNFGILLSMWDRLFGTAWEPASDEWPDTGIAQAPAPRSVREYLLFPAHYVRLSRQQGRSMPPSAELRL